MPEQWTPSCLCPDRGWPRFHLARNSLFFPPSLLPIIHRHICLSAASRFVSPSPRGAPEACGCCWASHHHQVKAALVLVLYPEAPLLAALNVELQSLHRHLHRQPVRRTHGDLHTDRGTYTAARAGTRTHWCIPFIPSPVFFSLSLFSRHCCSCLSPPIPPLFPVARVQAQTKRRHLSCTYIEAFKA